MNRKFLWVSSVTSIMLASCGGGSDSTVPRGSLVTNPPRVLAEVSSSDLATAAADVISVTGAPICGVKVHYMQYGTVGGAGEPTTASAALMLPTGCTGPFPVVLYAHGSTTFKGFNMAALTDTTNDAYTESVLTAATFAAQGYIVVAPNYAGYDSSELSYHPYFNADQQSKDMIDGLKAARSALAKLGIQTAAQLFVTGYSQGGYVAMATQRALQELQALNQTSETVTASAPLSGPYAFAAFADAQYYGNVTVGATITATMLAISYQNSYKNIYNTPSDLFTATYATGIDTLFPSNKPLATLVAAGKFPESELFDNNPPQAQLQGFLTNSAVPGFGFGPSPLVRNEARLAFLQDALAHPDGAFPDVTTGSPAAAPTNTMRQAFKRNDLRSGWTPTSPMLMCGGHEDATVLYGLSTTVMQSYWASATPGLVSVLDVDDPGHAIDDPYAALKDGFAGFKATITDPAALLSAYHDTVVPPFCMAAARGFFQQFQQCTTVRGGVSAQVC
jgi:dienelactone hydrolase